MDTIDATGLMEGVEKYGLPMAAQPIIPLNHTEPEPSWVELLLRPRHPKLGYQVRPEAFIRAAQRANCLFELEAKILSNGLAWAARNPDLRRVAINVTGPTFSNATFPRLALSQIRRAGVDPERLCLEVTEQLPIEHRPTAIQNAAVLACEGIELAVDDLTETTFERLYELAVVPQVVKLAKQMLDRALRGRKGRGVFGYTLQRLRDLGANTVVVEGVDSRDALVLTRRYAVPHVQGHFLAKPTLADPKSSRRGPNRTQSANLAARV